MENVVRNRWKSLLSFCTAKVHCSSIHSISSESIEGSEVKLGSSLYPSSRRFFFFKIRHNYSSKPVRWYSEKKVETSLSEEIYQFSSSSNITWNARNSTDPHGGLSKGNSFLHASVAAEDYSEAKTDGVQSDRENRSDIFYRKPFLSIQHDGEEILPSSAANSEEIQSLSHMISNATTSLAVLDIYEEHQNELKFQHYNQIVRKLNALIDRSVKTG